MMLKRILFISLAALWGFSASAQFQYNFKDTTTPYAALTGGTSLNGSTIWDDETYTVALPFTWTMNGNKAVNYFYLLQTPPSALADTNDFSSVEGFIFGDFDLIDRGALTGPSTQSPIRYQISGSAPNRIFKMELANAGFFEEMDLYNTANDFINLQIWVYERSNIVEYHYGPSSVTHPADYYEFGGTGPIVGYGINLDLENGTSGDFYFLDGNAAAPTLDSVDIAGGSLPGSLNAWPADGKVYRFTPKTGGVGVASTASNQIVVQVYPSVASTNLYVNYRGNTTENAEYSITSMTGAVLNQGKLNNGIQNFDISSFAAGTYFLQVRTKDASGNYRFVKQ